MSEDQFLAALFSDEDVPTDPTELLEFATYMYMYNLYLNAPPDSPLRQTNEINWEEFGEIVQKAKEADDEVKRCEEQLKEAEEGYKTALLNLTSDN